MLDAVTEVLLAAAAVLLVARLLVFVGLHVRCRSVDPLRDTVSDYGVGASRRLYAVMSVLSAAAYALVAGALWILGSQAVWVRTALAVVAVTSLLIVAFPTDRTGSGRRTTIGTVHWLLAVVNFTLLFVVISNASLPTGTWWAIMLNVLLWATRVSLYAFLLTLIVPTLRRRWVGLTERAFLVCVPLWFLAFAGGLATS